MDTVTTYMIFWIVAIVVFALIEIFTAGLTTIWFAAGSIVGLVMSFLGAGFGWQIAAFALASFGALFLLRPRAVEKMFGSIPRTNVEDVVGKRALVISPIEAFRVGQVKVGSQTWSAVCPQGPADAGEEVIVLGVEGVKLIVQKLDR